LLSETVDHLVAGRGYHGFSVKVSTSLTVSPGLRLATCTNCCDHCVMMVSALLYHVSPRTETTASCCASRSATVATISFVDASRMRASMAHVLVSFATMRTAFTVRPMPNGA